MESIVVQTSRVVLVTMVSDAPVSDAPIEEKDAMTPNKKSRVCGCGEPCVVRVPTR